jgi:hypothetical protein
MAPLKPSLTVTLTLADRLVQPVASNVGVSVVVRTRIADSPAPLLVRLKVVLPEALDARKLFSRKGPPVPPEMVPVVVDAAVPR